MKVLCVVPDTAWERGVAPHLAAAGLALTHEPDAVRATALLNAEDATFDAALVQAGGRRLALQKLYSALTARPHVALVSHAPETLLGSALEAQPPAWHHKMPSRLAGRAASAWVLEALGQPVPWMWHHLAEHPPVLAHHTCWTAHLAATTHDTTVLACVLCDPWRTDPASRAMFVRTARGAMGLAVPGVAVPQAVEDAETFPVALVHVPPGALLDAVARGRRPSPLWVVALMDQLLAALHQLHTANQSGAVHGAFTPQSVWLSHGGDAWALYPGLARLGEAARPPVRDRAAPMPHRPWLAPEQVFGLAPTPATDVYRCAQLAWALFAGAPPFERPTAMETVEAIGRQPLPAPPQDLPAALGGWLTRCLARNPADRPQSAGLARTELLQAWSKAEAPWSADKGRHALIQWASGRSEAGRNGSDN